VVKKADLITSVKSSFARRWLLNSYYYKMYNKQKMVLKIILVITI